MALDIETIKERLADTAEFNNSIDALSLLTELQKVKESGLTSNTDAVELNRIEAQLVAIAMHLANEQILVRILEEHVVDWLRLPESVDLIANLKGYLLNQSFIEDRNKQRDLLKAAIERSKDRLGAKPIKLGTEEVVPTISNWVKVYVADVGNTEANTVKFARFLAQNPSVQLLTPGERGMLKRLLYFYEFLKLRSESLAGFEDELYVENEKGELMVISNGRVEPVYTKEVLQSFKEQAREKSLDREILVELIMKFPEEFKEFRHDVQTSGAPVNPQDVPQKFGAFIQSQRSKFAHRVAASGVPLPNRTAALVAMLHKSMLAGKESDMVLAKEILQFTFSDQERLANFMRHISVLKLVQDDFPAEIGEKNRDVVRQSPVSPMAMQALLMIVFGKKFGLSPEETAWQSFEVISKLPSAANELKTVVTYNPSQDKLVWRYEEAS